MERQWKGTCSRSASFSAPSSPALSPPEELAAAAGGLGLGLGFGFGGGGAGCPRSSSSSSSPTDGRAAVENNAPLQAVLKG